MSGTTERKLEYLIRSKEDVRLAINRMQIPCPEDTPFLEYGPKIKQVQGTSDTSDATATAANLDNGIIAYTKDNERIVGITPMLDSSAEPFMLPHNGGYAGSSEVLSCNKDVIYLVNGFANDDMGDVVTISTSQLPVSIEDKTILLRYSPTSNNGAMYLELYVAPANRSFGLRKSPSKVWCYDLAGSRVDYNLYTITTKDFTLDKVTSSSWTNQGSMSSYTNSVSGLIWYLFTTNNMTHTGGLDAGGVYKGHGNEDCIVKTNLGSSIKKLKFGNGGVLYTRLNNNEIANAIGLTAADIKQGRKILGIDGSFLGETINNTLPVLTQLEYIESDGNQYIDTGVQASSTVGAELTVLTPDTTETMFFGAWSNDNGLLFGQAGSHWFGDECYSVATDSAWMNAPGVKFDASWHTYKYDATTGKSSVDGVETAAPRNSGRDANLYIFKTNGFGSCLAGTRVSSCKIYKNGTLIRNYIPVVVEETGEACMFDTVNLLLYRNKGTGSFLAGPLAKTYTKLDYIESTGTQYINTGYKPTSNTCYELVYSQHVLGGTLFGAYNDTGWDKGVGYFSSGAGESSYAYFHYYRNNNTGINTLNTHAGTIVINKNVITFNGKTYTANSANFTINYPLYISCANKAGIADSFVAMRIHSFIIKEGDIVVRNYIPVRLNKNGEIGLYDLVEEKFYGNAGTGEFITSRNTMNNIKYITNGLVNYFKLDGDLTEEIAENSAGNYGVTFVADNELNKEVCKSNDGFASFMTYDLPKTNFTLSILAKSDGTNTEENQMIFGYVTKNSSGSLNSLALKASNGKLYAEYSYAATSTTFNVNDGKWHRYTVTFDSSNIIKIYADDQLIAQDTKALKIDSNCYGLIGSWTPGLNFYFNGWLSDALIYDRVLTAEEIASNYAQDTISN